MPKFYFAMRGSAAAGEVSGEFDTVEAARLEAEQSGKELIADAMATSEAVGVQSIEVRDEKGEVVASVPLSSLLPPDLGRGVA